MDETDLNLPQSRLIVILGPTACGKTTRGVDLARRIGGEIVSADSRQVYRGMDVGTGKDLADYDSDVPYHLIDIVPAGYKYNLFEYLRDARRAIDDIRARGRQPIIVGGTGLYIESLLKGMNLPEVPENKPLRESLRGKSLAELTDILSGMKVLHNTTDVDTAARAIRAIEIQTYYEAHPEEAKAALDPQPLDALIVGVDIPRDERRRLISARLQKRFDSENMLDEVRRLLDQGIRPDDLIYYGLEYKFLTEHLLGLTTYSEMKDALEIAIHQFAKRQMTWFRGMERRGFNISWLPHTLSTDQFTSAIIELLKT